MPTPASLTRPEFLPLSIIRAIWKGRLYVVLAWVAGSAAVYYAVSRMPSFYYSEALVLVDSQKIPNEYVRSTVRVDAEERVADMGRRILSTPRLKALITELNLFPSLHGGPIPDPLVDQVRNNVKVSLDKNVGGALSAFRVGFVGPEPRLVAKVANRLAGFFVDENVVEREAQIEGTADFVRAQLREAKKRVEQLEAAVTRFKVQHTGELPEQQTALLGSLGALQAAVQANTNEIERARQNKLIRETSLQMAQVALANLEQGKPASTLPAAPAAAEPPQPLSQTEKELQNRQSQLAALRLRYSDDHPDIRRLTYTIEQLKKQQEAENRLHKPAPARPGSPPLKPSGAPPDSMEIAQAQNRIETLKAQIKLDEQDMQQRTDEQQRLRQQLAAAQGRLGQLPVREQEMTGLTRDYEIAKANYQGLLAKELAADMASDLERRDQSEKFKILELAQPAPGPFKPNRRLFYTLGSAMALALTLAGVFGNELRRNKLLGEWEFPKGTVVLGLLPEIPVGEAGPRARPWRPRLALWVFLLAAASAGAFHFLAQGS